MADNPDDNALFRQLMRDVRPLRQDRVFCRPPRQPWALLREQRQRQQQQDASYYFADHDFSDQFFSDQYQPRLPAEGPMRYLRTDVSPYELKKLRRGDYIPELSLDLHGMTRQQAKQELAALIAACCHEHIACACVMHGHGKNILKLQIPLWLAQHPYISAFHQAPKYWGGDAALLILLDINTPHQQMNSAGDPLRE